MSKKYGPVFTVHFGPKKVVVLASHKTVKEALVGKAEEFGDRDVSPIFHDINQGHGTCVHQLFSQERLDIRPLLGVYSCFCDLEMKQNSHCVFGEAVGW